jgi:tetratricopeptide (TPR) repeat protein
MKADGAFDQALELDPRHWDARFSKAISLAFWPPIFGKQAGAVKNFETLMLQQEEAGGASQPQYAQTYQFLGNLYMQQGNSQKAREIWSRGLRFFPNDATLKESLAE